MNSCKVLALTSTLIFCVSWSGAVAQEKKITRKQVPAPVLSAFEKAYPHTLVKGYAMEKKNGGTYYEVESVEGTTHRDVLYTASGTVAEMEETMNADQLPKAVSEALGKGYPGKNIGRIERTMRDGKTKYEVVIQEGKKKHEVIYDEDGKVLTKSGASGK